MPRGNSRKRYDPVNDFQAMVQSYSPPQPFAPPPYEPRPFLNVEVLGAKNATVAKVTLAKHGDWTAGSTVYKFEAADSSKREQGDVFDPVTGEMLALGRALQRLSRELFSEANKRVTASTEAQQKARQAAYDKHRAAKKPVRRRTKEEWEAIQRDHALMSGEPDALAPDTSVDATDFVRTQLLQLAELLTPEGE